MDASQTTPVERRGALRVALTYLVAASLWILLSDELLLFFTGKDASSLARLGQAKGFAFVVVTSAVLYLAMKQLLREVATLHARELKSRDLLHAICNSTPDGVFAKDRQGRYLLCNAAAAALCGREPAHIVGRDDTDLFDSSRARVLAEQDARILAEGATLRFEESFERDGRPIVVQTSKGPVRDASGQVFGSYGIIRDITELRMAVTELEMHRSRLEDLVAERSAALSEAEQRLRMIIESTAEGIVVVDTRGTIELINPATTALLGYEPSELIGRNVHAAIHHSRSDGNPGEPETCPLLEAIRGGRGCELLNDTFWHREGHALPVAATSNPILIEGKVVGAVLSFFDITERQRAEAAREQARAAAEQLARTKSEFLANMSHEIRTPLNGVLGFAQIGLRDSADNPPVAAMFRRILESGKLLLTIINDILDFSKIEAGKLAIESVPVDPRALVDHVMETMRDAAAAKGLALITEKAPDLPASCLGDPVRITQVLLNLLSNAVKFTPAGTVRLVVRRESDELIFTVSDTGIGIAPGDLERLFHPFEQADGSITRRFGGTGLGLSISRRLASMMHGGLTVQSTPGIGSSFTLHVPLRETTLPAASAPAVVNTKGPRLDGLKVLAAEDNEVNAMVLEAMLHHEGADVELVGDGGLAVEAVRRNPSRFDVVLMDIQMPSMDGLEATRQIHALSPDLPVIGQTAHAMKEEHDACRAAGMVSTLTKPLDVELLVSQLLEQAHRPGHRFADVVLAEESASVEQPQVIDWTAVKARFANHDATIQRLVALARKNTEGRPAQLRALATEEQLKKIAAVAHDYKAVAGNFAASELERLAARTHALAARGQREAIEAALALADELDRFREALDHLGPSSLSPNPVFVSVKEQSEVRTLR